MINKNERMTCKLQTINEGTMNKQWWIDRETTNKQQMNDEQTTNEQWRTDGWMTNKRQQIDKMDNPSIGVWWNLHILDTGRNSVSPRMNTCYQYFYLFLSPWLGQCSPLAWSGCIFALGTVLTPGTSSSATKIECTGSTLIYSLHTHHPPDRQGK